jgi:Family of unknown function (DUF5522)
MTKKVKKQLQKQEITEGADFYIENGLSVFTEKFLLERGFCCQNGCRHCPYGFKKDKTT